MASHHTRHGNGVCLDRGGKPRVLGKPAGVHESIEQVAWSLVAWAQSTLSKNGRCRREFFDKEMDSNDRFLRKF